MGDQLLQCPDTDLRKAIHRALGVRVATINVADLLTEMETLAVIKQSNHVNILAMIKSKQERDEPVRQFAARLRGLAAVCDLAATCTCGLPVSMVDKWVLMTLINGLYDGDTQQAVLSKVTELNLEETIVSSRFNSVTFDSTACCVSPSYNPLMRVMRTHLSTMDTGRPHVHVADLLTEMETLAVIKQSNPVNILAMIKSKQERDEPVRQFSARLRLNDQASNCLNTLLKRA